jgi:stalled ribosome alternative rescue factor ArfA
MDMFQSQTSELHPAISSQYLGKHHHLEFRKQANKKQKHKTSYKNKTKQPKQNKRNLTPNHVIICLKLKTFPRCVFFCPRGCTLVLA